ncbi:TetR/AcrR family transcriptional regulator [Brevundimonas sp.]|uniref:TetR/AcrR family transcriptional regulator n=1 Tax=Brevundimonas sp. TaxID=1871086 RepID=UPI0025EBB3D8|nr:TetR/AcrR family transcriptional regulator [Brevundimonas sp.]
MSRKSKANYHHGDLRRALVDEACAALEREGLEGVSLRKLAAGAGVSHNAPYRHFADRAALLAAAAEQGFADLTERLDKAASGTGGLTTLAETYFAFARERPQMYRLMFTSDEIRPPSGPEANLSATSRQTYAALREAVLRGVPDRRSDHHGGLAALMWGALHGFTMLLLDRRLQPWMLEGVAEETLRDALGRAMPAFGRAVDAELA